MSGQAPAVLRVAGIDVGSSAVKVVLIEDRAEEGATMCEGQAERIRRRDPLAVARDLFQACLSRAGWAWGAAHHAYAGDGCARYSLCHSRR